MVSGRVRGLVLACRFGVAVSFEASLLFGRVRRLVLAFTFCLAAFFEAYVLATGVCCWDLLFTGAVICVFAFSLAPVIFGHIRRLVLACGFGVAAFFEASELAAWICCWGLLFSGVVVCIFAFSLASTVFGRVRRLVLACGFGVAACFKASVLATGVCCWGLLFSGAAICIFTFSLVLCRRVNVYCGRSLLFFLQR